MPKPEEEFYFPISPAELLTMLCILDDCDNFGVPWYWVLLTAISTQDLGKVFNAFRWLQSEVQRERRKVAAKRARIRKKKPKPKPPQPPESPGDPD